MFGSANWLRKVARQNYWYVRFCLNFLQDLGERLRKRFSASHWPRRDD
jgi:hypothetical protein